VLKRGHEDSVGPADESEFWKSSKFWLTVAAIVLPFGWVLFALKFEPVQFAPATSAETSEHDS
jgi:hypothetical protein